MNLTKIENRKYICENGVASEVLDDSTIQLEGRLIGGCMDILQMYPSCRS